MSIREDFKAYTEKLAVMAKDKLAYWLDGRPYTSNSHGEFQTSCYDIDNFILKYRVYRANMDYEDYDSTINVPYAFVEALDYEGYADNHYFELKLEAKAKEKKKLEEDLRSAEYTLINAKAKVEELKKRLLT